MLNEMIKFLFTFRIPRSKTDGVDPHTEFFSYLDGGKNERGNCFQGVCEREKKEAEPATPEAFNVKKYETKKWVLTYKHQGPPCEYLGVGASTCHEFLASPKGLALRSTS